LGVGHSPPTRITFGVALTQEASVPVANIVSIEGCDNACQRTYLFQVLRWDLRDHCRLTMDDTFFRPREDTRLDHVVSLDSRSVPECAPPFVLLATGRQLVTDGGPKPLSNLFMGVYTEDLDDCE